jgi:transcriptional regulator with XRE-family HTH domain
MDKKTVNDRVIIAIKYILKLRPDLNKTTLCELLGVRFSTFSHMMNLRVNASVEMMTSLCIVFNISADWLLTGRGDMINELVSAPSLSPMDMFVHLVNTIKQQAEEIGHLKERLNKIESKKLGEAECCDAIGHQ